MSTRTTALALAVASLIVAVSCSQQPAKTPAAAPASPPPAAITAPVAVQAQIPPWGLDLANRDLSVRPGDNFFQYADGNWVKTHHIPADRTSWGSFGELDERSQQQVLAIVQALPADSPEGSNAQKVRDYFDTFLDTAAIDAKGLAPARAGLDWIAAAKNYHDLARLMGRPDLGLLAPIRVAITVDQKDPDRYMVVITQSGLGLPDRDYYLKDDPVYVAIRGKYVEHITRLLTLAGDQDAAEQAKEILATETKIAQLHWPVAKRRQRDLTYNPRTRAELEQMAPGFYWETMLATLGVDAQPQFVVRETDAVQGLAQAFLKVPVKTWRAYFRYHYLVSVAEVLPRAFDEETFDFYGRTLSGQKEQRPRKLLAVEAVNTALGEAVGELFVARHFPPSSKEQVLQLVENLRASYAERIQHLQWMTPDTKKVALEKLAAFHPKIGYPEQWRDYSAFSVVRGDAFGNLVRARMFEWQRQVKRLQQPTDRGEWGMTPQTINAYYNPTFNEVVFPAAILQPPFFDPHADPAVNYGGVGAVIGHEMGHGFDDQGSKSDARGVLRTWWGPADVEAFHTRTEALAAQYDQFEALPGLNVNGHLTLGENIGDNGGLAVAYEAYHRSLKGQTPPVLDGLTGDQRFFLAYAQIWRSIERDEALRKLVLSNPHSPPEFRVNGTVRNMDPWYAAFDVQPGDKLYLPPDQRVHIW
jgi:putative endopeptidase